MAKLFDKELMSIDQEALLKRLNRPDHPVDVVLDTDAYNEIDDQFAIAYSLRSTDRLNVQAIYAAPFCNMRCTSPREGMKKSFFEVQHILSLMDHEHLSNCVFEGSEEFLRSETEPVSSPAAVDLAHRAMSYRPSRPLYVIAIGAITNIASALLLNPEIRDRIVVIWLGGSAHHWPSNKEFNLRQDIAGGRILFGCGVAIVQVPAQGVAGNFRVSEPELRLWLGGKNKLCEYLVENTCQEALRTKVSPVWTRPIWDVVPVSWLTGNSFVEDYLTHSPVPEYDYHYSFVPSRHMIRYVYQVNRDLLMHDLFTKLSQD